MDGSALIPPGAILSKLRDRLRGKEYRTSENTEEDGHGGIDRDLGRGIEISVVGERNPLRDQG